MPPPSAPSQPGQPADVQPPDASKHDAAASLGGTDPGSISVQPPLRSPHHGIDRANEARIYAEIQQTLETMQSAREASKIHNALERLALLHAQNVEEAKTEAELARYKQETETSNLAISRLVTDKLTELKTRGIRIETAEIYSSLEQLKATEAFNAVRNRIQERDTLNKAIARGQKVKLDRAIKFCLADEREDSDTALVGAVNEDLKTGSGILAWREIEGQLEAAKNKNPEYGRCGGLGANVRSLLQSELMLPVSKPEKFGRRAFVTRPLIMPPIRTTGAGNQQEEPAVKKVTALINEFYSVDADSEDSDGLKITKTSNPYVDKGLNVSEEGWKKRVKILQRLFGALRELSKTPHRDLTQFKDYVGDIIKDAPKDGVTQEIDAAALAKLCGDKKEGLRLVKLCNTLEQPRVNLNNPGEILRLRPEAKLCDAASVEALLDPAPTQPPSATLLNRHRQTSWVCT